MSILYPYLENSTSSIAISGAPPAWRTRPSQKRPLIIWAREAVFYIAKFRLDCGLAGLTPYGAPAYYAHICMPDKSDALKLRSVQHFQSHETRQF